MGNAIILTAALSFIGLGAVPPAPEWGAMIAAGQSKFEYWWAATFPGLAILSVVLGFNFLGDGLQDALNPRLRGDAEHPGQHRTPAGPSVRAALTPPEPDRYTPFLTGYANFSQG